VRERVIAGGREGKREGEREGERESVCVCGTNTRLFMPSIAP